MASPVVDRSLLPTLLRLGAARHALVGVIAVIGMGLMARLVIKDYLAVGEIVRALRWQSVLGALLLMTAANLSGGVFWRLLLATREVAIPLRSAVRIWCLSAAGKYALGPITQYSSRVVLTEASGVSRASAIVGMVLELPYITSAGVAVLLALAPLCRAAVPLDVPPALWPAAPLIGLIIVLGAPRLTWLAARLTRGRDAGAGWLLPGPLQLAMIVVVGNWLLLGSAAFLVVSALGEADVRLLPFVVFASTFAMLAGLIAIVPMGIGVRDAAFAILLSLAMPAPVAVAASLAFRAVSVAADFACAGSWLLATVGERAARR